MLMAEHSICQPGLPSIPAGPDHFGSPGLRLSISKIKRTVLFHQPQYALRTEVPKVFDLKACHIFDRETSK